MGMWLVFLPLIAAIFVGLLSSYIHKRLACVITSGCMVVSTALAWVIFFEGNEIISHSILAWFDVGSLKLSWLIYVDNLTRIMLVVVTNISALVHIYSVGYMDKDPHLPRFMAYLSLFTFFMLLLVTSNNLIQLFVGWEGVGLCSYLLIGFWFQKESANLASMKAFIINRIADFAFITGIILIYLHFGNVHFSEIFNLVHAKAADSIGFLGMKLNLVDLTAFLLFFGAMGKSAQIGLHTWLPDAMEGPTPVSALIHAATMVTAGVFLVARMSPLFEYSPNMLQFIAYTGAITALFAATIALTQNDIKKIIAYSTCSQLGYMFFACGVSAYQAAIFHLMTHAFFKALLFLGAGSVIHALHNEQDIRKMGGLWNKIPATYIMMLIGSLAIVGIFPFAGYYSKDLILDAAYMHGSEYGRNIFIIGLLVAVLTAFYSWRLLLLVFHGERHYDKGVIPHESPMIMLLPLGMLSVGAIAAGWYGVRVGLVDPKYFDNIIVNVADVNILKKAHNVPSDIKLVPMVAGLAGIVIAYLLYQFIKISRIFTIFKPLYLLFYNKYYIDELYDRLFVRGTRALGNFLWKTADVKVIDGMGPSLCASTCLGLWKLMSKMQSGYVYHYAFLMVFTLVAMLSYYVFG